MKRQHSIATLIISGIAAVGIVSGAVLLRRLKRVPVATERMPILDVPIDPVTMPGALAQIEAFIASGQPHHVFTADASGIMRAQDDAAFMGLVKQADLVTPDGAGVILAGKLRGAALPERVSGVDLVEKISALAAEKQYRVYFFGAAEGIAAVAADTLAARYPGLPIAGVRNGFFTAEEEEHIVAEIAKAKPDVLFVALGIPKQEQFIRRHFRDLGVPVMIGIGGSFDVISGRLRRAPRWMQKAGLEWLFRFAQEPSRLPRFASLPRFIVAAWQGRK